MSWLLLCRCGANVMLMSDKRMRGRSLPDCASCPERKPRAVDVTTRLRASADPDRYEPEWNELLHHAANEIDRLRASIATEHHTCDEYEALEEDYAECRRFLAVAESAIARVRERALVASQLEKYLNADDVLRDLERRARTGNPGRHTVALTAGQFDDMNAMIDRLRAELAEAREIEARLNAVIALCDEIGPKPYWNKDDSMATIRATAMGVTP